MWNSQLACVVLLLTASAVSLVTASAEDSAEEVVPTEEVLPAEEVVPAEEVLPAEFRTADDVDHCAHYRRLMMLARRAENHLARMDPQGSRTLRRLIDEILMEAGMESFGSLLELYHVCHRRQLPTDH